MGWRNPLFNVTFGFTVIMTSYYIRGFPHPHPTTAVMWSIDPHVPIIWRLFNIQQQIRVRMGNAK